MKAMFEYDLWANRLWHDCLEKKGWPDPDKTVFQHILAAQDVWAQRVQGISPTDLPTLPTTEAELGRLHFVWLELLERNAHDPIVEYRRTTGEGLKARFSHIAMHLCNHGTYHRGELRGLCRMRADEDFPETDFSRYIFEAGIELSA